jgi:hypothetical protein
MISYGWEIILSARRSRDALDELEELLPVLLNLLALLLGVNKVARHVLSSLFQRQKRLSSFGFLQLKSCLFCFVSRENGLDRPRVAYWRGHGSKMLSCHLHR